MRKYELNYRKSKKKDKSGNYREWTSKTFYVIYYENRVKKYKDTKKTDRIEAEKEMERLIKEIEGGTVYSVIKNNNWLSEKESPLHHWNALHNKQENNTGSSGRIRLSSLQPDFR